MCRPLSVGGRRLSQFHFAQYFDAADAVQITWCVVPFQEPGFVGVVLVRYEQAFFWTVEIIGFAGNERRESGYGAECASVRVHPLPLVVHARSVVTAASSLGAKPVPD